MGAEKPFERSWRPAQAVLTRTKIGQAGPELAQRLQIDFRASSLLSPQSHWLARTSLTNRTTVEPGSPRDDGMDFLLKLVGRDGDVSKLSSLPKLIHLRESSTPRTHHQSQPGPKSHREYDILLSEWASIIAARTPWLGFKLPVTPPLPDSRQVSEWLKQLGGVKPSDTDISRILADLEDRRVDLDNILEAFRKISLSPSDPTSLLILENYFVHCGFPAAPNSLTKDGVLEIVVPVPSRDVFVSDHSVMSEAQRFGKPRLVLVERSVTDRNLEYSRQILRYLLALARAAMACLPGLQSVRILAIDEGRFSNGAMEVCAVFTASTSVQRIADWSTPWLEDWLQLIDGLRANHFVDQKGLDRFIDSYGQELLGRDAQIMKELGTDLRAAIVSDGTLKSLGSLSAAVSSPIQLSSPITDSFHYPTQLFSIPFWLDLDERRRDYLSELQRRQQKATPQTSSAPVKTPASPRQPTVSPARNPALPTERPRLQTRAD